MKLHIGCGPIKLHGYVNIDIESSHNPDVCANVLDLHYENVDVIYSCHMAEHLTYPGDMCLFLELCYKWLKPGGIFRLAVPDLELAAEMYSRIGDMKPLYGGDFKAYYYKDTLCERMNFFVKAWEHQMCYDYGLLELLLKDAGFSIIEEKNANQSAIPNFNHDRFISESLYIEAIK